MYIEYSGRFCNRGGKMGHYFDDVYELKNNTPKVIHEGIYGTTVEDDYEAPYEYIWDGNKMSEDEYEAKLKEAFGNKEPKSPSAMTYKRIMQELNE